MMHLYFKRIDLEKIEEYFLKIARNKKASLFRKAERLADGRGKLDLTVGSSTLKLPVNEIRDLFEEALAAT